MKRGVPAIYGALSLTAQAASIGTTTLLTAPPPGLYRITINGEITQAATTSSSLLVTIGYTNAAAVSAVTGTINGNVLGQDLAQFGGQIKMFRVASGNITYATTYASVGGTPMQYRLDIVVERIQ